MTLKKKNSTLRRQQGSQTIRPKEDQLEKQGHTKKSGKANGSYKEKP